MRVRQLMRCEAVEMGLETLDHLVASPESIPEVVLVSASWTSLLVGDAIAEIVDKCVATLTVHATPDA